MLKRRRARITVLSWGLAALALSAPVLARIHGPAEQTRDERSLADLRAAVERLEREEPGRTLYRDAEAALRGAGALDVGRVHGTPSLTEPFQVTLDLHGTRMTLDLAAYSVRAPGFFVEVVGRGGKSRRVDPGPVRTVRGSIVELPGSLVVGSVRPGGLELSLEAPDLPALWLEPVAKRLKRARPDLYALTPCGGPEGPGAAGACGLAKGDVVHAAPSSLRPISATAAGVANCASLGGCLAEILCDTDSAYYSLSGSSAAQVQANVESLIALTNPRFVDPFFITHRISQIWVRSDPAIDPYTDPSITSGTALLNAISDAWPQGSHTSDLIHLFSGHAGFGTTYGLAWQGGVCSFGGNSMVSFSIGGGGDCTRAAFVIHELGHSWGSSHTSCGGGIMSPSPPPNCNAPWCDTSLTEIPARRDQVAGLCLELSNQPPQARFTFSCSALACTFDASGSTDDHGITGYAWSFGDSGSASGVTASHTFAAGGTYTVTLTATDTNGATGTASRKVNVIAGAPAVAEGFFTVPLCRVYDSRNGTILSAGVLRTIQITGACGIPATAKAISANVTSVSPSGAGWMTFYPGNVSSSPFADTTSSLNFDTGVFARANNVILLLSTDGTGKVNVLPFVAGSPGQVHLVIDVYGYSSEDAAPAPGAQGPLGFQVLTPCRVVDTRTSTSLSAGTARSFTFQGVCGIPAGAAAVAVNATAVWPTAAGYVVLYPSDGGLPPVSTLNFNAEPTSATANGARLRLAPTTPDLTAFYGTNNGGAGTSHLIVDAQGYFKSDAPLRYHPLTPCRAVDTRAASTGGPVLANGETRAFQIKGNCGVPATAKAVAANLTAVTPAGTGFLSAYPTGTPYPGTSVLNFDPTQGTIANGVIVPLATAAYDLNVFAGSSSAHLLIDVFGYFE